MFTRHLVYYFISRRNKNNFLLISLFLNMSNDDACDANDNPADDEDFCVNNIGEAARRSVRNQRLLEFLLFADLTLVGHCMIVRPGVVIEC